ncbi:DUF2058 domain-containing protein [Ferrimonas lipolytica]|uniref:DUF2058 domain-containing protein n=1 Tax=Ferrimonas lipolytica TaxID=2724191 RepID=A0A6H1UIT4_9GAMM|nr:DUF2058 domain-containing protein [Ferrimonas lipolytica]QIZ78126.1 DUF2058 domain-containing protein [Ferrimonas lipolytica]
MSLQDQLMKAGLVSKHDAKKANKSKHRALKSGKKVINEAKQTAVEKREEQAKRDRELNAQRKAEADKKALIAQIKQLISTNSQDRSRGEIAYNFSDKGTITKVFVTEALQNGLVNGQLAIAKLEDSYHLIPTGIADKVKQRDDSYIVLVNDRKADTSVDEEDPYADFQIPDDLMW